MDILTKEIEKNMEDIFSSQITIYQVNKSNNSGHTAARARVLYKGENRNKTFINDAFAKLLQITAPYIPIVGEYSEEKGDFLGHTEEAIPYGCVVKDNNFAWEEHLDKDGIKRNYACFDVVLWTAKYEKAKEIVNKSLSMELDRDTIAGNFKVSEGKTMYYFTDGELLALCTLGDDIEPCFEGASFYEKYSKKEEYVEFDKFVKKINNENGGNEVEKRVIEFKLSHEDIRGKVWEAVNKDSWNYGIAKVYDDYALMYDYENQKYLRQYYSTNKEEIALGESIEVVVEDLTLSEYEDLKTAREKLEGIQSDYEVLEKDIEAKEKENEELFEKNEELEKEKEEFAKINKELEEKYSDYEELIEYKLQKEDEAKKALVSEYETMVPADFSFNLKEDLSEYTFEDLESELAIKAIKSGKLNFNKTENTVNKENLGDFQLTDNQEDEDDWISLVKKNKSKNGRK